MKVLRLGNSNDVVGDLPREQRAGGVAEAILAQACGESVETINRTIWPTAELPDLLDSWLDRYEPDLVFLHSNPYWNCYQSVPLKIERMLPAVGRPLRRASNRVTAQPWVTTSRAFRSARWVGLRTIGGATFFTTDEVIERLEACIRRVLAREHVALVVRGTLGGKSRYPGLTPRLLALHHERRRALHEALKRLCGELHVVYTGLDTLREDAEVKVSIGPDRFHHSPAGHQRIGTSEGEAMVEAWRRDRG